MPEYLITDLTITVKFNAQLDAEKKVDENSPKYPYTASVTYDSVSDAVEKAGKFTVWALARRARKGDLPRDGRTITVNGEGEYKKSAREEIAEMSDADFNRLFAEMEARKAAIELAVQTESTPEPEMTEEELENATAPVTPEPEPDKKAGRNKTSGKN